MQHRLSVNQGNTTVVGTYVGIGSEGIGVMGMEGKHEHYA